MGVKVEIKDRAKRIGKNIDNGMRDAFTDVILDVKRVSSESAPHRTGFLENNRYSIEEKSSGFVGYVGFEARSKRNFDYATWTHDADYNLGEKSRRKRGGASSFGNGIVPVGKGYLQNTVDRNSRGYLDFLDEAYKASLDR